MQLNEIRLNQLKKDIMSNSAMSKSDIAGVLKSSAENGAGSVFGASYGKSDDSSVNGLSARDSFYGKNDLSEDMLSKALTAEGRGSGFDTAEKNALMFEAAKDIKAEQLDSAKEEGWDLAETGDYDFVTVADHIKMHLAKGGTDISMMGDISDAALAEDPSVKIALEKAAEISSVSDDSALYLVKNDMAPTIDNVYKASFASAEVNAGAKAVDAAAALGEKLDSVFGEAMLPAGDAGREIAAKFLENDIPITPETLNAYTAYTGGELITSPEEVLGAIASALGEGRPAGEAIILAGLSDADAAADAAAVIEKASPEDVETILSDGGKVTVLELARAAAERKENAPENKNENNADNADKKEERVEESAYRRAELRARANGLTAHDAQHTGRPADAREINEGKRVLYEAQLVMTFSASYTLVRNGINIDTTPLSELVDALKQKEEAFYGSILGDASSEKVALYETTISYASDMQEFPTALTASYRSFSIMSQTLSVVHADGEVLKASYVRAERAYETYGTEIRRDLGDSIKKAFGNIPGILSDLGFEDNETNEKAVRILGYNNIEITKESLVQVRNENEQVDRVLRELKPATIARLIKEDKNPLEMTLSEIHEAVKAINAEGTSSSEEQFGRFLWQAERSGEINADERESFIGIARLVYQVKKTDGAVIGQLLQEGAPITLANMLKAIRSSKKAGMDYTVDDDFGGVSAKESQTLSISDQIEKAFQTSRMADAGDTLTPGKLHAFGGEDNYLSMSPDGFASALENMENSGEDTGLQKEASKNELRDLKAAIASEQRVYSILESFDMPATPSYLSAVTEMLADRNAVYRKLFGIAEKGRDKEDGRRVFSDTDEEAEGKSLSDVMEDVLEAFGEAVKTPKEMAEAQRKLAETAENAMDGVIVEGRASSVDIREMRLLRKELNVLTDMGERRERYEIPVLVQDGNGVLSLKIVRGKEEEKGAVEISFDSQRLGNIEAAFKLNNGVINGQIMTDREEALSLLSSVKNSLSEAMAAETESEMELTVSFKKEVRGNVIFEESSYDFETAEPVSPEESGSKATIQTRKLYGMARTFINALKNI